MAEQQQQQAAAPAGEEVKEKKVIDEVSGWLRTYDDGTVDRSWTGPPEALYLIEVVPPFDTPRDGITVHDIQGDPMVRLYIPEPDPGHPARLPVLLHFHGGGFCISHVTWFMYYHFYARLAREVPAIVVSVELPLAPETKLPTQFDVCYRALLWLRSLAQEKSTPEDEAPGVTRLRSTADFSKVFLIGDSSGGNIVHEVCARSQKEEDGFWTPLRVAGGIPINPGFVRSTRSPSELESRPESEFLTLDMVDKFLLFGLPEGATKDHPYTCPMGEAAPPLEEVKLPPFLVGVADGDLMRHTNLEYYDAMKASGKEVELVMSKGVSHSFYLDKISVDNDPTTIKATEEIIDAIRSFVDRH